MALSQYEDVCWKCLLLACCATSPCNSAFDDASKRLGPHGPGQPFETSEDGHIILPPQIMPYFRQYYSQQIWDAWGDDVRFFPLGSRQEFPQPDPATLKPASQRGYVYGYMVSFTDEGRRVLYNILRSDTTIPEHKVRAAGV